MYEFVTFPGTDRLVVDHVSIRVIKGWLSPAYVFFRRLGYIYESESHGTWGNALYLSKPGSVRIQLTEVGTDHPEVKAEATHLCFKVISPIITVRSMQQWADDHGVGFQTTETSSGKYFVHLAIFNVDFELIPNPKTCPKCKGEKVIWKGREGMGYHLECENCNGLGIIE